MQLAVPAALIGVGFVGLESDWLKRQNTETRDELLEHPHSKLTIDDISQFAPVAACYGLRLCGVRSIHDYADMTIIAGTAYLLAGGLVYGIKSITKIERPDGSSRKHFHRVTQPQHSSEPNFYVASIAIFLRGLGLPVMSWPPAPDYCACITTATG